MKWFWKNTTQIVLGQSAVREHLSKFVQPQSRIPCTFGFGSIDRNGARADVQAVLGALSCEVRWEGGIPTNPEYDRLSKLPKLRVRSRRISF
jgi:alcohol dehydrogenase YqhD (iron-dependent ADH family)